LEEFIQLLSDLGQALTNAMDPTRKRACQPSFAGAAGAVEEDCERAIP
jgi:hypothetical protein